MWDKSFFSSVEEWRETAKAIIDKYFGPAALFPFKVEIEITVVDQQVAYPLGSYSFIRPSISSFLSLRLPLRRNGVTSKNISY